MIRMSKIYSEQPYFMVVPVRGPKRKPSISIIRLMLSQTRVIPQQVVHRSTVSMATIMSDRSFINTHSRGNTLTSWLNPTYTQLSQNLDTQLSQSFSSPVTSPLKIQQAHSDKIAAPESSPELVSMEGPNLFGDDSSSFESSE